MADNTGLFIVLMIACAICIVSSVLMSYTCTGGTWDFDNFKASKCVEIPEDETDPGSGGGSGSGGSGSGSGSGSSLEDIDPASLDNSEHYALCSGAIHPNDAKTCWNEDENGAGVRWAWSEAEEQALCKGYAAKYRIIVSSSFDDHVGRYFYDKSPGSANSFRFKNAPNGWLEGNNVKFVITALTSDDKRVISPITVELDAGESTDNCEEIGAGIAIEWSEMQEVPRPDTRPPPPPPRDCSGGEWVLDEEYGCLSDGVKQDKTACGPSCMQKFDKKGDDFVGAAHGGTCELTKYELFQRQSCSEYEADAQIDCVWGEWTPAPLANGNPEPHAAINMTGTCSKECGGGTQRQAKYVSTDDENVNSAEVCGTKIQHVACNTQDCPIDCYGGWQCGGWTEYETNDGGTTWRTYTKRKKRDCTWKTDIEPNSFGEQCPSPQTKTEDVFISSRQQKMVSDKRLKKNIKLVRKDFPVPGINLYTFDWNDNALLTYRLQGSDVGFLADEFDPKYIKVDRFGYKNINLDIDDETMNKVYAYLKIKDIVKKNLTQD